MTPDYSQPLSLEDLAELYRFLKDRVNRIDGHVRQILAERTRDTLGTPTWRDIDALKKDIADLQRQLASPRMK